MTFYSMRPFNSTLITFTELNISRKLLFPTLLPVASGYATSGTYIYSSLNLPTGYYPCFNFNRFMFYSTDERIKHGLKLVILQGLVHVQVTIFICYSP